MITCSSEVSDINMTQKQVDFAKRVYGIWTEVFGDANTPSFDRLSATDQRKWLDFGSKVLVTFPDGPPDPG